MIDRNYTSADGDSDSYDAGAVDRNKYRHWWEHALRDIRQHSVASWAQRVVSAYVATHDGHFDMKARAQLHGQALDAALAADGRFIGDWSTPTAIDMSRKSLEELAVVPLQSRRSLAERRADIGAALAELRDPNRDFVARLALIKLGESMLARLA